MPQWQAPLDCHYQAPHRTDGFITIPPSTSLLISSCLYLRFHFPRLHIQAALKQFMRPLVVFMNQRQVIARYPSSESEVKDRYCDMEYQPMLIMRRCGTFDFQSHGCSALAAAGQFHAWSSIGSRPWSPPIVVLWLIQNLKNFDINFLVLESQQIVSCWLRDLQISNLSRVTWVYTRDKAGFKGLNMYHHIH